MGGGAGIKFESDTSDFKIHITYDKENKKYNTKIVENGQLESFNMSGYQEGLSYIRGEFLNPIIKIDINEELFSEIINNQLNELKENYDEGELEFSTLEIVGNLKLNDMIWAGYSRGSIEDVESLEAEYEVTNAYVYVNNNTDYSECEFDEVSSLEEELRIYFDTTNKAFHNVYNDIFNSNEEIDEFTYEDIKANYCI